MLIILQLKKNPKDTKTSPDIEKNKMLEDLKYKIIVHTNLQ